VPLITAIEVRPAGDQDGPQAAGLVEQQPERRRPRRLLGDTACGTGPVRGELAQRQVAVLAPVPEAPVAEGRLAKRDFVIDIDAGTVTCPAGHLAAIHPHLEASAAPCSHGRRAGPVRSDRAAWDNARRSRRLTSSQTRSS
jgi:hypothetical protein